MDGLNVPVLKALPLVSLLFTQRVRDNRPMRHEGMSLCCCADENSNLSSTYQVEGSSVVLLARAPVASDGKTGM